MQDNGDITGLLLAWRAGEPSADERLFPLVYDELRRIAHGQLSRERAGHTLDTTALVHEAYFKLVDQTRVVWTDRGHFFAIAAQMMRRILVDHARHERRAKRGGGVVHVGFEDALEAPSEPPLEVLDTLALDRALQKLEALDPEQGRIVEMRFFGGLTIEETASALGISPTTVKREWTVAKGYLHRELTGDRSTES